MEDLGFRDEEELKEMMDKDGNTNIKIA